MTFATRAELLALHFRRDAVGDLRLPATLSSPEFPAYAREEDAAALRAAGYFVLSFSRPEVTALACLSGWCEAAWAAGYDARLGVERHYSDGGLVVYFHPSAIDAASAGGDA